MPTPKPVSDHAGQRIREERKRRKWTPGALADRCCELGYPDLTTNTIKDIESGRRYDDGARRRGIELDELFTIADALDCKPFHLLPMLITLRDVIGTVNEETLQQLSDTIQAVLSFLNADLV